MRGWDIKPFFVGTYGYNDLPLYEDWFVQQDGTKIMPVKDYHPSADTKQEERRTKNARND